jgi:hypothetical protein
MAIISKQALLSNIAVDLADNNAGLISAADIRNNLFNTVDSMNSIIASGDFNLETPFGKSVRVKRTLGDTGTGFFIAENGINFPNATSSIKDQIVPYPGPTGINHNDLFNRDNNASHSVFLTLDGSRLMAGNLGLANNWIGASGYSNVGLSFQYRGGTSQNVGKENILVGNSGEFVFSTDNSRFSSGKSVAKAWITFDGANSGVSNAIPVVKNSYNIRRITRTSPGKYVIYLKTGVLYTGSNNFVVVANSNARTDSDDMSDFERNTVGTKRGYNPIDGHFFTFVVLNEAGEYVDAEINDAIVFGEDIESTVNESSSVTSNFASNFNPFA